MKIRSGFVSNSSSSSFVMIAFEIKKSNELFEWLCKDVMKLTKEEISEFTDNVEYKTLECCGSIPQGNFCAACGKQAIKEEVPISWEDICEEHIWECNEKMGFDVRIDTEDGSPNDNVILLGKTLAEGMEEEGEIKIEDFEEIMNDIKKLRNNNKILEGCKLSMFYGNYAC